MKGDFTRLTHDPDQRYTHVLYQQGRVALDADPNEQAFINDDLRRIANQDIIGPTGAPSHAPGFEISVDSHGGIGISKGQLYVDGILCENAKDVGYVDQADFPSKDPNGRKLADFPVVDPPVGKARTDLVYVDVWRQFITAVEDPAIRDPALGGPDTATRLRTVAQVKVLQDVKAVRCDGKIPEWTDLLGRTSGVLTAFAPPGAPPANPCEVVAGGGYTGLENHLYRVEIHGEGEPLTPRPADPVSAEHPRSDVDSVYPGDNALTLKVWETGAQRWMPGQFVEVYSPGGAGFLGRIVSTDPKSKKLFFPSDAVGLPTGPDLKVRRIATWKWSRDNGSIVYPIEAYVSGSSTRVRLETLGRDAVLHLGVGDQVEVSDTISDLYGFPGAMGTINTPDEESREVVLDTDVSLYNRGSQPRLRRWDRGVDQPDVLRPVEYDTPFDLEFGVQVTFPSPLPASLAWFSTGDWWAFWSRARTHSVEPFDSRPPLGIKHHYAKLALITWPGDGTTRPGIEVCRPVFPALTELTSRYLGGDGQEGGPGEVLPYPLRVGVAAGELPVSKALVQFHVVEGGGSLVGATGTPPDTVLAVTTADGVAQCSWQLGPTANQKQRVLANLVGVGGAAVPLTVQFAALCQTPVTGGGCTVALGPADPLQDSIAALLRGHAAVRICLLPGAYQLGGLVVDGSGLNPRPSLRIEGCGPQSRIQLDPKGKIQFKNLSEVELAHLDISGGDLNNPSVADSLLDVSSCDSVVVESCRVLHVKQGSDASALRISGVAWIRIEEDRLESRAVPKKRPPFKKVTGFNPMMVNPLLSYAHADLKAAIERVADAAIQQASLTEMKGIVTDPHADGGRPRDKAGSKKDTKYLQLMDTAPLAKTTEVIDRNALVEVLQEAVDALAGAPKGNALGIGDNTSATIARCTIVGTTTLYGDPPPSRDLLSLEARKILAKKGLPFGPPRGDLRVERNDLTRLDISEVATNKILAVVEGRRNAQFDAPYRSCFLVENVFEPEARRSYVVARHVAMTLNTFQRTDGANVGTVIADTTAIMGNQSLEPPSTLEYVARFPGFAANLILAIKLPGM